METFKIKEIDIATLEYKIEKILDMAKYDKNYRKNRKEYVAAVISWINGVNK
jgi:hypothetical protein